MATITLSYDARKGNVKHLLDVILATGLFKVTASVGHYDSAIVEKVKKGQKDIQANRCKAINTANLW